VSRTALAPTALALAALALALACSGCETTAQKSAKLEKTAKRVALARQTGLSITRQSTVVKATGVSLVRDSEGSAAIVTLRNPSARALRHVPIAISLKDAHGASVYSNSTPGLATTLTSLALLPAHGEVTWIDDQITTLTAKSASARIGEGETVNGTPPQLLVQGTHLAEDPNGGTDAEGTVTNASHTEQRELVLYAVARRAGRLVAAGRAVLTSLPAGSSAPFQIFFIGDPKGAQLQLSAPPTTY
jgi:hypothetical protein